MRTPSAGTEPALLDEHRKSGPDRFASGAAARELGLQAVPLQRSQQLVEEPDIVAGIVLDLLAQGLERTMIRHLVRPDGIAPPHVIGIDAEPGRDRVHQPLAHEGGLEAAGRAVGRRRRLVGQAKVPDRAIGRHPIGPGKDARRHVHDARGMGAHIGALVVKVEIVDRKDAALAVDRRPNAVELLARMIGRDQVLAPVLDPFHRPAKPHGRDADQYVLWVELAADAEAAADMGFVHVDRRRRQPEHAREQLAIAVRHLGGAVQLEDRARGVVAADGAAGLQRNAGMAADRQFKLHHHGCGADRGVDVAVALPDDRHLGVAAGRELARLGFGGKQRRQLLDLHGDEIGCILGDVEIVGEHRSHRFPDIAHAVGRQHRLAVGFERGNAALAEIDRRHVGDVGRGPDRDHARQGARGRGIDRHDPAVGMVGANDAHMKLVRKGDVAGETSGPSDQRRVLQPLDRPPDPFPVAGRHRPALILAAAARTAFTMFSYPVQRQRLDDNASTRSSSLISGSRSSTPVASMRKPGVQKPHCSPWFSMKACCSGCRSLPFASPSTVRT